MLLLDMTQTLGRSSDLQYFSIALGGSNHGGWYRLLPGDCVEMLAIGLMRTLPLEGQSAEVLAVHALTEFVRERQLRGEPVPTL